MTEHLTKETFKEKVFNYEADEEWAFKGDIPCVIDWFADWCKPCQAIAPVLEELSEIYDGKIKIYKINTEDEYELASIFGIRSIPTLFFIPLNSQPEMVVGGIPKDSLIDKIDNFLLTS